MNINQPSDDELIKKAFSGESSIDKLVFGRNRVVEMILLFLSLPVLIPSLLISFIMAKRWGRVDFILLAVDGFVILLFSMGSPFFFIISLIAMISSGLLYILRHNKIPYGIFLGYSNLIAMMLMIGGVLFAVGFFRFVPWAPLSDLSNALGSYKDATVKSIMINRINSNTKINVVNAKYDWKEHLYKAKTPEGEKIVSMSPQEGFVTENPNELWTRGDELLGNNVTINTELSPSDSYKRNYTDIQKTKDGPKEIDSSLRQYVLIQGTEGRVWVASKLLQGEEESEIFQRKTHSGKLLRFYSDANQGRWYNAKSGKYLPYMCVVVMPSDDAQETLADKRKTEIIETIVPICDTRSSVWAVFAGELKEMPKAPVKGFFEGHSDTASKLAKYLSEHPPQDRGTDPVYVIVCRNADEYIRNNDLTGKFIRGFKWFNMLFIMPGFAIIIWALFIAKEE